MNILFIDFGSYMAPDLLFFLEQRGDRVRHFYYDFSGQDYYHNDAFEKQMEGELSAGRFDCVMSSNFFPVAGKVCHAHGLKYLAWSYDAPMNLPRDEGFDYTTNYIFLFDRGDYLRNREKGLDTVFHLPLAVNTARYAAHKVPDGGPLACDVSFLGTLYESTFPVLKSQMTEYDQGFMDALVRVQSDLYGAWLVDDLLTADRIDAINAHYRELSETAMQITAAQLSYAVATHITHRDRLSLLKILSERADVLLCSGPLSETEEKLLPRVRKHGRLSYAEEMPKLFKLSKINLNATLRCIKTGISLRALDIMGCAGFLLSNFQEELAEYVVPGEEAVLYESIPDAVEKAAYYLAHEDERKRIAENGFARMQADFRYEDRIEEMFRTAGMGV